MRNVALLRFLAAVVEHGRTVKTLMDAGDFDALELQLAVAIATEEGFVEPTGQMHPNLRLTAEGRKWAAIELAPFAALFTGSDSVSGRFDECQIAKFLSSRHP